MAVDTKLDAPGWTTYLQLILTILIVGAVIGGAIFITKAISDTVKSTKENLKTRGLTLTDSGLDIKTNKRFDREAYIDATQAGMIKSMSAASFVNAEAEKKKADALARAASGESKPKKSLFKRKNT